MAGITTSGIGSGLDINSLVSQLVAAEGSPVTTRLDKEEADSQAKLSALGTLKGALSDLQSSLAGLQSSGRFDALSASSADSSVYTASATGDAYPGTFSVEVVQLAQNHKLISAGFSNADATVGTGSLTITVDGTSTTISVDDSNGTLSGIRDAINAVAGDTGVRATIVNVDDGSGGTESKLVLRSDKTGADGQITVAVNDGDGNNTDTAGLSVLAFDPAAGQTKNLTEVQAADDAKVKIDGQSVTRSNNTISDAIDGVTLQLVKADPGETHTLSIATDTSQATSAINSFVASFNRFVDLLGQVATYDASTKQAGVLFGDALVRGADFQIRQVLGTRFSDQPAGLSSLAEIGITTGADGKLGVDTAKLNAALEQDMPAVGELVGSGYADRLQTLLDGYLASDGSLAARTDGLNKGIKDITAQRDALSQRLDTLQSRLLKQYTAMDALVGQLQSTSSFLTQQLSALSSLSSGKSSSSS